MYTSCTLKRQMESLLASYSFFRKNKHAKTKLRDQSKMLEKKCLFNLVNWKKKKRKNTKQWKGEKKVFVQKYEFCCWLKRKSYDFFGQLNLEFVWLLLADSCYFNLCQGPWVLFVMTDEFSVRATKITSRIDVSWTHSLTFCF